MVRAWQQCVQCVYSMCAWQCRGAGGPSDPTREAFASPPLSLNILWETKSVKKNVNPILFRHTITI